MAACSDYKSRYSFMNCFKASTAACPDYESKHSFMSCVLKVNSSSSGWQRTVRKVLSDIDGVRNFTMDDEGRVTVSGMVDPQLLLKRLCKSGKKADLCWFQFGDCSSNLYPPPDFSSKSFAFNETKRNGSGTYGHFSSKSCAFNKPKGNGSGSYGPFSSKSCTFNEPKGNGSASYGNGYGRQGHYSGGEYGYGDGYGGGGGQEYNIDRHAYRPFAPMEQSLQGRYAHFGSGYAFVPSAPPME